MENMPKHTKKEDWERFIEICSTDEERIKREKDKSSKEHMKLPHTSGRHGCARIEYDLVLSIFYYYLLDSPRYCYMFIGFFVCID